MSHPFIKLTVGISWLDILVALPPTGPGSGRAGSQLGQLSTWKKTWKLPSFEIVRYIGHFPTIPLWWHDMTWYTVPWGALGYLVLVIQHIFSFLITTYLTPIESLIHIASERSIASEPFIFFHNFSRCLKAFSCIFMFVLVVRLIKNLSKLNSNVVYIFTRFECSLNRHSFWLKFIS